MKLIQGAGCYVKEETIYLNMLKFLMLVLLLSPVECRWAWIWGFNYESDASLYTDVLNKIKVNSGPTYADSFQMGYWVKLLQ